jgi:hypothetical protein
MKFSIEVNHNMKMFHLNRKIRENNTFHQGVYYLNRQVILKLFSKFRDKFLSYLTFKIKICTTLIIFQKL